MSDNKTSSSSVGYRRPPVGRRFEKGRSGNPAGRPKGSRNQPKPAAGALQAMVLEEAYRLIKVTVDDEETDMPIARTVIRSLIDAAARGDLRARAAFLKVLSDSEEKVAGQAQNSQGDAPEEGEELPHEIVFRIVDPKQQAPD